MPDLSNMPVGVGYDIDSVNFSWPTSIDRSLSGSTIGFDSSGPYTGAPSLYLNPGETST